MGVPQRRRRVFFYAIRNDLLKYIPTIGLYNDPYLNLRFNLPSIKFKEIDEGILKEYKKGYDCIVPYFKKTKPGYSVSSVHPKGILFSHIKMNSNDVSPVLTANCNLLFHSKQNRQLTKTELSKIGTFPLDYNFLYKALKYKNIIIGMSVPPVMIAQIANQIKIQWLNKFPKGIK